MNTDAVSTLYVDSDPERAESVRSALRETHPEVDLAVAETRSAAEATLSEAAVDCVVARTDLSDADAVAFLSAVRERWPAVTTVLFGEDHSPELFRRVRDAGVDEYVRDAGGDSASVLGDYLVAARADRSDGTGIRPEPYLDTLLDIASDVVLTIDEESVVRFANPAVEDVLGYAPEELEGEPLTTVMPEEMRAAHREGLRRYLETNERRLDWDDVELPARHEDGHEVPLSIAFNELETGDGRRFLGIARDVTDRKRRERELERYEAMLETVRDGVYVLDASSRFIDVNPAFAELVGKSRAELVGEPASTVTGRAVNEEVEELHESLCRGEMDDVTYETTLSTPVGEVPVESHISLFPLGDGEHGRIGVVRDVSERRRREEQLASLNETAQALTAAQTAEEVSELAVRAAAETLGLSVSAIELYDGAGELVTAAKTRAAAELVGDDSLFGPETDALWDAYATDSTAVFDDVPAEPEIPETSTPLRSAIVVPIGKYGVFVTGETEPGAFTETDVALTNILVANVRAALERTDREETLRERKAELEARTETLERVHRINDVIRKLTRALTEASSREEIEQVVCTQLANAEPYRFVWIGEQETVDGELVPRASAGVERGYLADITVTSGDEPTGQGPAGRAIQTHEVQVQNDLHADPPFEPWRAEALQRGFRASITVPLVYRDSLYGVLNLYAGDPGVFDELEVNVLAELGRTIGFAINALERRKAIVSDQAVELEFRIEDPSVPPATHVSDSEGTFALDALVEQGDGTIRSFFVVTGVDPETVLSQAAQMPNISDANLLSEYDDGHLFEATLEDESFFGTLLSYGAHPTGFTATADEATLTVELPRTGDVRAFLDMFLNAYDGVELVARRELDRPIQTRSEFRALYRERLTDRQEEVLRTAYFAGFFDWPRRATGKEVAEILGVSQPTVNRHVRKGEYELFSLVFGDDDDGPRPDA